jgi:prepilin-type N-terminal cleavage/methylation domain-containing protein
MKLPEKKHSRAFTLVEVLVTITITVSLAGISVTGYSNLKEKARMTTEINAARSMMIAYLAYPTDHNGKVMSGYQSDPTATDSNGIPLAYPMNARYPWRLAANLPRIEGNILFNGNESVMDEDNSKYLVSVMPNLGINSILVGGHFGSGSPLPPTPRLLDAYGKFYLSSLAEAESPEKLIVFASARSGENRPGYFEIRPPRLTRPVWSSEKFSKKASASKHGFVDFRYRGKAVTASLAGNVELLTEEELRDMRRWSNQAARENNRNFTIENNSQ